MKAFTWWITPDRRSNDRLTESNVTVYDTLFERKKEYLWNQEQQYE